VSRVVAPSLKVTVPVALGGDTVAISKTESPDSDGLGEVMSVVMVTAWLTVCVRAADVLPAFAVSPP